MFAVGKMVRVGNQEAKISNIDHSHTLPFTGVRRTKRPSFYLLN